MEHHDKYWYNWDKNNGDKIKQFPLLIDMVEWIKPESIMELGCGGGANLVCIQDAFPEIELYGVDVSNAGVEVTRNHVKGTFNVLDARYFKQSVDLVLTVHALEQMRYIIKDVVDNVANNTEKVLLFEPFFCMQNVFGKWHTLRSEYVQGVPFFVKDAGFDIKIFKKTRMGNFLSHTGMLYGVKNDNVNDELIN